MIDEETYKKEIVRMWDTLRGDENKGKGSCDGVYCGDCPLSTQDDFVNDTCTNNINAFKVITIVEKWSAEHPKPKHKISQIEYDILKYLSDNTEHTYITRDEDGGICLYDAKPKKIGSLWIINRNRNVYDMTMFSKLFQFVQWEDKEPTLIKDVLNNCEVDEDND